MSSPHFSGSHLPTRKWFLRGNVDFVHASRRSLSLSVYFCTPVGITSVLLFVWEPANAAEMDNFVTTLELMAWQKRAKSTLGQLVAMLVRPSSWIRVALFGWNISSWRSSSTLATEELPNHGTVGMPFVFYSTTVVVSIYLANNVVHRLVFSSFLNVGVWFRHAVEVFKRVAISFFLDVSVWVRFAIELIKLQARTPDKSGAQLK